MLTPRLYACYSDEGYVSIKSDVLLSIFRIKNDALHKSGKTHFLFSKSASEQIAADLHMKYDIPAVDVDLTGSFLLQALEKHVE